MIQRLAFKTHMIVTTTNSQTIDDIAQFKNGQHSFDKHDSETSHQYTDGSRSSTRDYFMDGSSANSSDTSFDSVDFESLISKGGVVSDYTVEARPKFKNLVLHRSLHEQCQIQTRPPA